MADGSEPKPYRMREPCRGCGCEDGTVKETGAQDVVRCADCKHFCYNAPRVETGKAVRTVQTVHEAIKPKLRARILERSPRCELCGKGPDSGCAMHVGHVISVENGLANGLTEIEINDDTNLMTLCDECNLGLGKTTISVRTLVVVMMARMRAEK